MTIEDRVPPVDLDLAARPPSSAFRRWLAPVAFAVFGLVDIFVLGLNAHHGDATFAFSQPFAKVTVPNLTLPAAITCYVCGAITLVMAALRAFLPLGTALKRVTIAVVIFLFVLALLCWADAGQTTSFNVVNLLQGTFNDSIPIMLGALTGVVCSRSGVINVGIEGQLLLGAFTAAIVASGTGSLWLGLVCGALAGSLVGVLLAVFAIGYRVDQVILGVVLNTLILGLTGYLYDDLMVPYANTLNSPPRSPRSRSRCSATSRSSARSSSTPPSSSTSPTSRWPASRWACSPPGGGCAPGPSASTRSRPTPWASR